MIFGTTDFTYHGDSDPLQCPEGMTRKSLALYYFSNGPPADEITGEHSALFRARNEKDLRPTVRQRVSRMAADFLPPILTRQLRRIR